MSSSSSSSLLSGGDIYEWKRSEVNVVAFYGVPLSKDYLTAIFMKKLLPLALKDSNVKERLDGILGCFDEDGNFDEEIPHFNSLLSDQEGVFDECIDLRIIGTEHRFFVVMGQEFNIFNSGKKHKPSEKSGILEDKPDEKEVKKYNVLMKELGLKPEKVRPVVFVTVESQSCGYLYERDGDE